MARLNFWAPSGEVTLAANTPKTVWSIKAPTNIKVALKRLEAFGKGIAATDHPIKIRIGRITSDGTGTPITMAPANDDDPEAVQATGKANYTVEPTYGTILRVLELHPQAGFMEKNLIDDETLVGGGHLLGIEMTYVEGGTVSLNGLCEE